MKISVTVRQWALIALFVVIGVAVGAAVAKTVMPQNTEYRSTTNVAMTPAPNLSITDASSFWEVLTRGQINRIAATVYADQDSWLPTAAAAAGVSSEQLKLTAAAVSDTTIVTITVDGPSAHAAEAALKSVLDQATPVVLDLSTPFAVKSLAPEGASTAVSSASDAQILAVGGLVGAALGAGLGLLTVRLHSLGQRPYKPGS